MATTTRPTNRGMYPFGGDKLSGSFRACISIISTAVANIWGKQQQYIKQSFSSNTSNKASAVIHQTKLFTVYNTLVGRRNTCNKFKINCKLVSDNGDSTVSQFLHAKTFTADGLTTNRFACSYFF